MIRRGLTVPLGESALSDLAGPAGDLAKAVAAGYSDAWTSEVAGTDAFAPLMVAGALYPELRLGTSIAGVFSRSPAQLAMQALGLAESSVHPVHIGIGTSSQQMVANWHGGTFDRPYSRVRDTVAFLRRALAGDRVTMTCDSFAVDGFRLARVPRRPPRILVAALQQRMLRLAGEQADGVILNWLSPDDVRRVSRVVLDRNPEADVVGRLFIVAAEDVESARAVARRHTAAYLSTGVYAAYHQWLGRGEVLEPIWRAWHSGDRAAAVAAVPDALVDELFLLGDVADIKAGIRAYTGAGITIPVVSVISENLSRVRELSWALATS